MPTKSSTSSFGNWLRTHRKELRVTQPQLAAAIDCSLITLQKIESSERRPSRQVALLLAAYFGVPVDEQEAFVDFARADTVSAQGTDIASSKTSEHAPWRSAYVRGTNLPALLSSLVGREREKVEVSTLLARPPVRLLTLTGPPGIGKTRLALRVASDMLSHFTDGVYLVELATIADCDLVVPAIARTLGLEDHQGQSTEERLLEHLRDKRMLLLLDNFEQVLDAAPAIMAMLLASPWLKALVTSREALHLRGERRFSVRALELPDPAHMSDPGGLLSKPSVQLFVERAQATSPNFELTTQNAEDVASICISLDGLPLAIELAAARIGVLSTRQIRAALQRRLTLLASEDQDLPPRQRTLRTAIDWSYQLLSAQEKRLFQELGIFVGGFTLEAARQVRDMEARSQVREARGEARGEAKGEARGEVRAGDLFAAASGLSEGLHLGLLDGVSSLMDKSLLQRGDNGPGEQRFTMLETIREYALDKLAETGEIGVMEHRHSTYFLGLIKEALPHLKGPDEVLWLARLDREHNNIRAALDWALEYDVDPALRAIITMGFYWYLRGQHAEMLKWRDRALAKSGRASAATRARVLTFVGWSAYEEQEFSRAKSLLEEGLALSRRAGDTKGIALALSYLGIVLSSHDDFDGARAALDEAMVLELEAGNRQGVSWLTNALAEVARLQDDWGSAHTYSQQGLEYAVQAADKYKIALSLLNLGWATTAEGDAAAAEKYLMDGMALMRELGDKIGVSWCLAALTGVVAQGHPLKTARLSGIVERLLDDIGHQLGPADARQYNRNLDMAREQLERLDWEAARKQGRDAIAGLQNLDQIIVYVLEHVVP